MSSPGDPLAVEASRRPRPLTYGACFHAQQTAEKYIKAVLVMLGHAFPRTHDLDALHDLCLQAGSPPLAQIVDLDALQSYAVDVRYPGVMPAPQEARRAILSAGGTGVPADGRLASTDLFVGCEGGGRLSRMGHSRPGLSHLIMFSNGLSRARARPILGGCLCR